MRVSDSGTSNLKFLKVLNIIDLHWSPVRRAPLELGATYFPVPTLHIRTYTPCKWEGMGMHSLTALVCQLGAKYRWNLEIAGQIAPFWRGSIKRLDLRTTYRYRVETFGVYSYPTGVPSFVVTRYNPMRVSHSGTSKLEILESFKHYWPASEPCK